MHAMRAYVLRGRGAGGIWGGGGSCEKKMALKGGPSKKMREKGGSRKIFL